MIKIKEEVGYEIQKKLLIVSKIQTDIDNKIDREFVDRLFNKFRVLVSELKEKVDQIQSTFLSWVTREELEEVLIQFSNNLKDIKDTAVGTTKYQCLLCGKPRTHVSGMMLLNQNEEENEKEINKSTSKSKSRIQSPLSPKKRLLTPSLPRDIVQLITSK